MNKCLIILVCSFQLLACSKRYCGFPPTEFPDTNSNVLMIKRIGVVDSTYGIMYGTILGRDTVGTQPCLDTLSLVRVSAQDTETGKNYWGDTDDLGHYEFWLPSARYNIEVQHFSYNKLVLKDAYFGSGEVITFSAIVGQGTDSTIFQVQGDSAVVKLFPVAGDVEIK